jgi:prepilin-type N-terminal cleavage/methylation domain-containing protein
MLQSSFLMNRRRQAAFSLIEVSIVSALFLVLLSGLYMLTTTGLGTMLQTRASSDSRDEALKGMQALCWELANSSKDSVADSATLGAAAVWFLSADLPVPDSGTVEFQPGGRILWQKRSCYYLDITRQTLMRSELDLIAPTPFAVPAPGPSPTLSDFESVTGAGQKVVARQVSQFEVALVSAANYRITISSLEKLGAGDKKTEVRLETQIGVRN